MDTNTTKGMNAKLVFGLVLAGFVVFFTLQNAETADAVTSYDIWNGVYKAWSFGVIVAWMSCFKGFYARRGAQGVSSATTQAVVLCSVLILVWDYFLTSLLFVG